MFEQKEAGQYLKALRERKEATLKFRVAKWLAARVAGIVGANTRVLDSRIPLPSVVYRSVYWHRVNNPDGRERT